MIQIDTVTGRLLAFVLAFIVSSPNCWCCVPHEQTPVTRACCHQSDSAKHESGSKEKCPCELSLTKRSVVEDKLVQPILNWKWEPQMAWENNVMVRPFVALTELPSSPLNESPPWRSSPRLYAQHCALLL